MKEGLKHLAIILDGNGRWARKRGLDRSQGHKAGAKNLVEICRLLEKKGISYLSLYAFSTENWKRPDAEVKGLWDLLVVFLKEYLPEFMQRRVKIQIMGDLSALPLISRQAVLAAIKMTEKNEGPLINIGLNYGGQDEIIRAFKKYLKLAADPEELNPEIFNKFLDTANLPPVDLLIRTGGERRLSNFMLWQLAYTEFYFTDCLWPDFDEQELDRAIENYYERDRRFGGVK